MPFLIDFFRSSLSNGYTCSESALLLLCEEQIALRVPGLRV